jgi:putative transcriptional regulator
MVVFFLQSWLCIIIEEEHLDTRIKELRKEKKISQEQLALAVGTTRQTITSIEVGKYTASLALAYKIARYFGLTIEEVFDFSEIDTEGIV